MPVRPLVGLLLCLAWAHAVAAQARGDAEPAEEIVITGIRTGTLEHAPSAFAQAIFTDDFAAERKSLPDLLAEGEGVFVRRFGGAGDRSEVSIRGSSAAQVVVSIDGVRANSALSGGLDLSRVCLPLVESVEIYRGAGASWQGSGAVGGTVNLNTRGATDQPVNRIGFSGGAFDTYEGSLFRSARVGSLGYSLGYCGFATQGDFRFARPTYIGADGVPSSFVPDEAERINNERVRHASSVALEHALGPGRLRFGDHFAHSRGGEPGIDCCGGETAGQSLEAHSTDWSNLAQIGWRGEALGLLGDELDAMLYHRYEASDFEDPLRPFGEPIEVRANLSTLGARLRDRWQLALGPSRHEPGLQIDFSNDRLDSSEQSDRARSTAAASFDDRVTFFDERLLLAAAVRADWTEDFDWHWVPSLGVVVTPLRWLRIRGNAGRAFRVPSFDELYLPDKGYIRGNPGLDAEDALNLDAGFELRLAQLGPLSELSLAASYFWRSIDDSIVWVLINASTIAPINTGSATSEGVELSLAFQLSRYLHVSVQHTELDSTRDATGLRLPGQPERETSGRVRIGVEGAWKLVGEAQYTGDILVSEGGGARLPSRTVWNASASLNLASVPKLGLAPHLSELWIFFEMNNIGDVAVRDSLAFPQPGRHASAGFEVSW